MRRPSTPVIALVLAAALVVTVWLALNIGLAESTPEIVWGIRAPRVAMALVIGCGLASAGVLLQGSLGNPLADPALIGVSSGAALGCVVGAALGLSFGSAYAGLAATVGASLAIALVVSASMRDRRPEVVTLLLAGVAVAAFASAAVAVLVSLSSSAAVRSLTFWNGGSLALSTWEAVATVTVFTALGLLVALTVIRPLDVLSLGDRDAIAAGVNVTNVRYRALAAVVLLVGAGVGAVGIIAFVGLVIPHAVRGLIGPRHTPLLAVSGLLGALVLLVADTAARVVANPVEVPLGAVTALIGAPVFFILLRRTRARQGGWA